MAKGTLLVTSEILKFDWVVVSILQAPSIVFPGNTVLKLKITLYWEMKHSLD